MALGRPDCWADLEEECFGGGNREAEAEAARCEQSRPEGGAGGTGGWGRVHLDG